MASNEAIRKEADSQWRPSCINKEMNISFAEESGVACDDPNGGVRSCNKEGSARHAQARISSDG